MLTNTATKCSVMLLQHLAMAILIWLSESLQVIKWGHHWLPFVTSCQFPHWSCLSEASKIGHSRHPFNRGPLQWPDLWGDQIVSTTHSALLQVWTVAEWVLTEDHLYFHFIDWEKWSKKPVLLIYLCSQFIGPHCLCRFKIKYEMSASHPHPSLLSW